MVLFRETILSFGKKGPWELVIKPRHVGISALLFSSFIFTLGYFSVQTINTALSVANQELISPADASLIATQKAFNRIRKITGQTTYIKCCINFWSFKKRQFNRKLSFFNEGKRYKKYNRKT